LCGGPIPLPSSGGRTNPLSLPVQSANVFHGNAPARATRTQVTSGTRHGPARVFVARRGARGPPSDGHHEVRLSANFVPELPWFRAESRGIGARRRYTRTTAFAGDIRKAQKPCALLAMQKVEGSNPFSRFPQRGAIPPPVARSAGDLGGRRSRELGAPGRPIQPVRSPRAPDQLLLWDLHLHVLERGTPRPASLPRALRWAGGVDRSGWQPNRRFATAAGANARSEWARLHRAELEAN
jgi:hypothetical protein